MIVINNTYKCVEIFWSFKKADTLLYLLSITSRSGVIKFRSIRNANKNAISKLRKSDFVTRLQNALIKPSARSLRNRNPAFCIL